MAKGLCGFWFPIRRQINRYPPETPGEARAVSRARGQINPTNHSGKPVRRERLPNCQVETFPVDFLFRRRDETIGRPRVSFPKIVSSRLAISDSGAANETKSTNAGRDAHTYTSTFSSCRAFSSGTPRRIRICVDATRRNGRRSVENRREDSRGHRARVNFQRIWRASYARHLNFLARCVHRAARKCRFSSGQHRGPARAASFVVRELCHVVREERDNRGLEIAKLSISKETFDSRGRLSRRVSGGRFRSGIVPSGITSSSVGFECVHTRRRIFPDAEGTTDFAPSKHFPSLGAPRSKPDGTTRGLKNTRRRRRPALSASDTRYTITSGASHS